MPNYSHQLLPKFVLFTVMVGLPISFFLSLPWLKQQSDSVVFLWVGFATVGTVLAGLLLGLIQDRKVDEWQRTAARFAGQWGWLAGTGLVAVLIAIPALQNVVVAAAADLGNSTNTDDRSLLMAFALGSALMVFVQTLCVFLIHFVWQYWMKRPTNEL